MTDVRRPRLLNVDGSQYLYRVYDPDPSNPKSSKAIRVLIPDHLMVIKMFDEDQGELWSLKSWKGDIEKVASYWRMIASNRELTDEEKHRVEDAITSVKQRFQSM